MPQDLDELSDAELRRRMMALLKKNCDKASIAYPPKLTAYLAQHGGKIPTAGELTPQ